MIARDIDNAQVSQQQAMNFNALEAQKARNWQEKMYGQRYQMTMKDIKKAGLNPYIINSFSPGGFSNPSAAQIASNIYHSSTKNKSNINANNLNTNKKADGALEWINAILPLATTTIGAILGGPIGAFIGGGVGNGARAIVKRIK